MGGQFRRWGVIAATLVVPFTALLHNRVFYRSECMLNSFGLDYYPAVVVKWLSHDPSLPLGIALAIAAYFLGRNWPGFQSLLVAFQLAFLPVSLWVWDLPFSGRIVCHNLHDGHSSLRAIHVYLFSVIVFVTLVFVVRRASSRLPS